MKEINVITFKVDKRLVNEWQQEITYRGVEFSSSLPKDITPLNERIDSTIITKPIYEFRWNFKNVFGDIVTCDKTYISFDASNDKIFIALENLFINHDHLQKEYSILFDKKLKLESDLRFKESVITKMEEDVRTMKNMSIFKFIYKKLFDKF